ncbi:MAG: RsmD family RNA methyltransferase [Lentisphaeraceae bacterium]|nr:RsmD family RNA methyltransferase [Lentisphaeraceae bacterium]
MKSYLHIFKYHHEDTELYKLEQKYAFGQGFSDLRYFESSTIHSIEESSFGVAVLDIFYKSESLNELREYLKNNLPFLYEVRLANYSIGFEPNCIIKDLRSLFPVLKLTANLSDPKDVYLLTRTKDHWYFGRKVSHCPQLWVKHKLKPETMSSAIPHMLARSSLLCFKQLGVKTVIDYCSGSGTFAIEGTSLGLDVTAIDLNRKMIAMTRRNLEAFNFKATSLSANATNFEQQADLGVVDFPYGFHCQRDLEEEKLIIQNVIKCTKMSLLIHGEDISDFIEKSGGEVFDKVIIPSVNLKRHLHLIRTKNVSV